MNHSQDGGLLKMISRTDPVISSSVDPLAENYYNVSPYVYCAGNPVMFVDPDGENPIYRS